jgi:imidazolonepropionase
VDHHALLVRSGRIEAIVPEGEVPAGQSIDLGGRLLTPGLIDCHTHLVFGGSRAQEWEQRLNGVAYQTISANGGGINATVRATRESSETELLTLARQRLARLLREGVTTLEIKSGYGLDLANERKMLRVVRQLAATHAVEISPRCSPPTPRRRNIKATRTAISIWCVKLFCPRCGKRGYLKALMSSAKTLALARAD